MFQILVVLFIKDLWKETVLHFIEIKWVTLRLLLDLCRLQLWKRKSCLKTRANRRSVIRQVSLACSFMLSHKWMVDLDILCSAPLDTLELSNQIYRLRSPAWRGIAKMGSYWGEVCRASKRNAFDESGVSPYITRTRRQEAIRTIISKPGLSK